MALERYAVAGSVSMLLLLALVAGCLSSQPRPLFRPAPAGFAALAQEIAKFRGLPLRGEIRLAAGFAEDRVGGESTAPFELKHVEQAYKNIGLLPRDADLAGALGEFRRLDDLFNYDNIRAAVALAPAAARFGVPFEMTDPTLAREAPFGFAIVAALQEQNFRWQEKITSTFLEDQRLAWRALATGDAAITLVARAVNRSELTSADLTRAGRFASELEKSAAHLPVFLRDKITFPYRDGSRFVLWALKAKGWPGVDALYANPPPSTAALLHPEKYFFLGERPLRFFPAALLRRAKERLVVEQRSGEQLVRGLLATSSDPTQADETVAEWRGDQLFAFYDDAQFATVWYSAWTSSNQATTFQRLYKSLLERRSRIRFEPPLQSTTNSSLSGRTSDNHGAWLEARGTVVLWLSGVPIERLRERVDDAWRDVEIAADPDVMQLDAG